MCETKESSRLERENNVQWLECVLPPLQSWSGSIVALQSYQAPTPTPCRLEANPCQAEWRLPRTPPMQRWKYETSKLSSTFPPDVNPGATRELSDACFRGYLVKRSPGSGQTGDHVDMQVLSVLHYLQLPSSKKSSFTYRPAS